jgi:uncharacterized membrane protein
MIEITQLSGIFAASILSIIALALIWWKTHGNKRFKLYHSAIITIAIFLALGIYANVTYTTLIPAEQTRNLVILYDNSTSMSYHNITITEVLQNTAHLTPQVQYIAQGERSDLVSSIQGSLFEDATILIVSDGYSTDGESYQKLLESAQSVNAKLYSLKLPSIVDDASVIIEGPQKAYASSTSTYIISVLGNNKLPGTLEIYFNGELEKVVTQYDKPIYLTKQITADSTVEAKLIINDAEAKNNEYYKTTRVIQKPLILYQGNNERLEAYLSQLFTIQKIQTTTQTKLSDEASALILANQDAQAINMDIIHDFVSDGNGLAVIGGDKAYDFGGYDASELGHILPVMKGKSGDRSQAVIVIAIDISASTDTQFSTTSASRAIEIQKAIAYNLVEQLSDETLVGVVAFNTDAYLIQDLSTLGSSRSQILQKIAKIQMQGGTRINVGLLAAHELLQNQYGSSSVILISDGQVGGGNDGAKTQQAAKILSESGVQVYAVGVGSQINEGVMRQIAKETGGLYISPSETERLAIKFGDTKNRPTTTNAEFSLFISDPNHPITMGLMQPKAKFENTNVVLPKPGSDVLITNDRGDPSLVTWNYGIGRVGSWLAFSQSQEYGTLLGTDSIVFSRYLSWVVGDPERKNPPLLAISDTQIGTDAQVIASATSIVELSQKLGVTVEELAPLNLQKLSDTELRGYIKVSDDSATGIKTLLGRTYAQNYKAEYEKLGQDDTLRKLSIASGGEQLTLDELSQLKLVKEDDSKLISSQQPLYRYLFIALLVLMLIHIAILRGLRK